MLKIGKEKSWIKKKEKRRKKTRNTFTYSKHLDVITLVQIVAKILQSGLYLEVQREKGNISSLITINM